MNSAKKRTATNIIENAESSESRQKNPFIWRDTAFAPCRLGGELATATVHPIHFEDYSGTQFERLVFAYHLRAGWTDLVWHGQ